MGDSKMINYGFTKEIDASFEDTLDKVSNELKIAAIIEQKLEKVFDSTI